jgi:hypothetical protein
VTPGGKYRHSAGGRAQIAQICTPGPVIADDPSTTPNGGYGHGMILIEGRVDLKDATYRVLMAGLSP